MSSCSVLLVRNWCPFEGAIPSRLLIVYWCVLQKKKETSMTSADDYDYMGKGAGQVRGRGPRVGWQQDTAGEAEGDGMSEREEARGNREPINFYE